MNRTLRLIGGTVALLALLAVAWGLLEMAANGRYQTIVNNSGLVLMTDTRTGTVYMGAPGGETVARDAAKRWHWTPIESP